MQEQINTEIENKKSNINFKDSKYATGRRKKSIARVWVQRGSGNVSINGKKLVEYFTKPILQITVF